MRHLSCAAQSALIFSLITPRGPLEDVQIRKLIRRIIDTRR